MIRLRCPCAARAATAGAVPSGCDRAAWPRQVLSTRPLRASTTTQSPIGSSPRAAAADSVSISQADRGGSPRAGEPA